MFELKRKLIHGVGLAIPLGYFFIPRRMMIPALGIVCSCSIAIEILRFHWPAFNAFIFRLVGQVARTHEERGVTGATYYFIAAFISIVCFSPLVAIGGLLFLVVGDSTAALIGTRYGAHKIGEKSIEGSLACFLVCLVVGTVLLGWIGIAGAIAATLSELAPLPLDDNLRIPLISGIIMHLLS
jgi:dolichol kinase